MMNKLFKKVAIAFAAATMAITATTMVASAAPCNKQGYVTVDDLAVRTAPGTDAERVGTLNYGDAIIIIDTNDYNGWTKIGLNGEKYVYSSYISEYLQGQTYTGWTDDHGFQCDSNVAYKDSYTVNAAPGTYLAVRNAPTSDDSAIIGQLYPGEKVSVIDGSGKFWTVCTPDGGMGYVNSNYLA